MYGSGHLAGAVAGAAVALGGGTLPFTGFSLVWWVLLAAMLFAVGTSLLHVAHVVDRMRRRDRPEYVPATLSGNQSHDPAD